MNQALINTVWSSKNYGDFIITNYIDYFNVSIKFIRTGFESNVSMTRIRNGQVKDYSIPSFAKHIDAPAIMGVGKYDSNVNYDAYTVWSDMITRCYNKKYHQQRPTYRNCSVCAEWLNFQNFAGWYYSQIREDGWMLDKDIIVKHNKLYCPERCAFVPVNINSLFTKADATRSEYPIGVHRSKVYKAKQDKTYEYITAQCSNGYGKNVHLGNFQCVEDAFNAYKTFKEALIKKIATEYKCRIDSRIYNAMINYTVEITD